VCAAIKALEARGILSWVNRTTRIRVREKDLFGQWVTSWRVVRTSNAYVFRDPKPAAHQGEASKTKPQWRKPGAFHWDYTRLAKAGTAAVAPDETIEITVTKQNGALPGFNQ